MNCDDLRELIEPLAARDIEPDTEVSAHLAACSRCAARLALARRLDALLAEGPAPEPPANFASSVAWRIRTAWWRSEQMIDRWFNVAIVFGLLCVFTGLWLLLNISGLTAVTTDVSELLVAGLRTTMSRLAPALPTYLGAIALALTALTLWWWAERDLTL